jgi:cholesterol transport system auxiliary component
LSRSHLGILLAAPVLAVSLGACISVLPKTKPDQLYSFGHGVEARPAAIQPVPGTATGVLLAAATFPRSATGDGILTITGSQSAYIDKSRWTGPAAVLFREAIERAFDRQAKASRLISRGETSRIGAILRVDVRDFAALYPNGPESIPVVALSLRARLARADGRPLEEKVIDVRKPASENRVGAIVDAFDEATTDALTQLGTWTDQVAATIPPEAAPPAVSATTTTRSTTTTTVQPR